MKDASKHPLQEMFTELLNGVEWRKLKDVADFQYGYPFAAELFTDDDSFCPLIRIRDIKPGTTKTFYKGEVLPEYLIHKGDILVGMDGEFNLAKWQSADALLNQRVCKIKANKQNKVLDGFLYHYLLPLFKQIEASIQGSTVKHLSAQKLNTITIPVPPLPVQEEIVRILDNFTNLAAELQAELQARQQQYEHYKRMLFSFDENVKEYSLMSLCSVITDGSHFSPKGQDEGFPMVSVKDMRSNCFDFNDCKRITSEDYAQLVKNGCRPQKNDVLVAKDGSMLKYSFVADGVKDYVILSSIAILRPKIDIIIPKYLAYYFSQNDFKEKVIREHKTQGGVPRIVLTNFKKVIIKVPSLAEQQRIVDILDRFDTLTTDITAGLPAEIEARRKQYEYYRDRLLRFKRM